MCVCVLGREGGWEGRHSMQMNSVSQSPRESDSRATAPAPPCPGGKSQQDSWSYEEGLSEQRERINLHATLCPPKKKGSVKSTQNSDKEKHNSENDAKHKTEPGLDDGIQLVRNTEPQKDSILQHQGGDEKTGPKREHCRCSAQGAPTCRNCWDHRQLHQKYAFQPKHFSTMDKVIRLPDLKDYCQERPNSRAPKKRHQKTPMIPKREILRLEQT